jgi:4-aminobutyrate--pyruvate transaminase
MRDAQVHFTVSGSEANDYAVKFLRYYNNAVGRPAKKKVIARYGGYHGATLVATSLTGMPRYHQLFDAPLPGILHTADPHFYRYGRPDETPDAFVTRLAAELEALIVAEGPETVAAFVAEPVTGGGGVVVPPAGYYDAVQAVLRRYDVAFVSDEIITGFGRTGNDFGAQTLGIQPDLMTVGKSLSSGYLPIAALVVSGDVYDGLRAGSDEVGTFAHGATHSGHPVAAAVAVRTLQLMRERDVLGHVRRVAARFADRLVRLTSHPLVGEVRSCGLMGAVELVADRDTRRLFDPPGAVSAQVAARCVDHGLLVRTAAVHDVVTFSPPLVITEPEIDELFDRFERALADVRVEE